MSDNSDLYFDAKEEGKKEGRAEVIKRMNSAGFAAEQIAKILGFNVEKVNAVLADSSDDITLFK